MRAEAKSSRGPSAYQPNALPLDPNTKWFKRTLIYYDTDAQYANFRGNSLRQATKQHLNNS